MSEFPEDILEKAAAMFTAFERPDFDEVCAAIMAERERCAKIAIYREEFCSRQVILSCDEACDYWLGACSISAAIMKLIRTPDKGGKIAGFIRRPDKGSA